MISRPLLIACALASLASPALAQYKVVAPDGSVTYTDRPPVADNARVSSLGRSGAAASGPSGSDVALPFDLRQVTSRFPVTLYTGANCMPCDSGRRLLQQRGVPYTERLVVSLEDSAVLERLTGGRTIPSLTIGAQQLRGFNPTDWTTYIDAAGYPAESRLPRGWQAQPATPLVAKVAAPAASAPPEVAAPRPPVQAAPPADTAPAPTLRF
jgi:glutaredoxin